MKKIKRSNIKLWLLSLVALLFIFSPGLLLTKGELKAAAINLINDPSFDKDISQNWFLWKSDNSSRVYTLARGYETPFGHGPYSLAIKASGSRSSNSDAGIVSTDLNRFTVSEGKNYSFSFYAKAGGETKISLFLESAENYQAISSTHQIEVSDEWQKHQVSFKPSQSGKAALSIVFGNIADGETLFLDGFYLFENNISLNTKEVVGYIGETNKSLDIKNGNLLSLSEYKIELPYLDKTNGKITRKQFSPSSIKGSRIYFEMMPQTFSGTAYVYASGSVIGEFNYNVKLKLHEYSPEPLRADEDVVVHASGLNPNLENNVLIVRVVDKEGKYNERWIKPHYIDNSLSQAVFKLPAGIVSSRMSLRSYHNNLEGASIENKSNSLNYKLKPVINSLNWSKPGYEQIGDKINITGKGIANRSTVKFYDEAGNFISQTNGQVVNINEEAGTETIEVPTPSLLNKVQVTVEVDSYESDKAEALNYSARPILRSIDATHSRRLSVSNNQIPATKVGKTIKLNGSGFKSEDTIYVNLNSLNGKLRVPVASEKINKNGTQIELTIPKSVQSGQISLEVNGETSNELSLEIIPDIVSITPLVPSPGEEMSFWVSGFGLDIDKASVYFKLNNNEIVSTKPTSLTISDYGDVIVKVNAPKAISNNSSSIKLQYDYWSSDESYELKSSPVIVRAGINPDNKIMNIKGHGFSSNLKENIITYKYADGTIVDTKAKMLSIENTSEGQEIRVQILDDYYYGYISIKVGEEQSNELNIGPAVIARLARRVEFVTAENRVMGVLYISGRNFGKDGDVKLGDTWAKTHYRTNTFIIAVVEKDQVNQNPVIVTKK